MAAIGLVVLRGFRMPPIDVYICILYYIKKIHSYRIPISRTRVKERLIDIRNPVDVNVKRMASSPDPDSAHTAYDRPPVPGVILAFC
jgi:hypothetical protein